MSATVEKIATIRVTTGEATAVLMMTGLEEGVRIVCDLNADLATKLCRDLIAAGFGPTQRGGHA